MMTPKCEVVRSLISSLLGTAKSSGCAYLVEE